MNKRSRTLTHKCFMQQVPRAKYSFPAARCCQIKLSIGTPNKFAALTNLPQGTSSLNKLSRTLKARKLHALTLTYVKCCQEAQRSQHNIPRCQSFENADCRLQLNDCSLQLAYCSLRLAYCSFATCILQFATCILQFAMFQEN